MSVSSLLAVLSALALVVLALVSLRRGGAHSLDQSLAADLLRRDHGAGHSIAEVLRRVGEPVPQVVLAALAVGIGLRRRVVDRVVAAVLVVVGADLTGEALKLLLVDGRYGPVARLFPVDEHTFPSGHATTMTALTFAFLLVVPRRWRLATASVGAVATVAVGTAMVVLHRHWPSDVLGGILLGCVWGFGAIAVLAGRR